MVLERVFFDAVRDLRLARALVPALLTLSSALAGTAGAQVFEFDVTVDKSFLGAGSDETAAWIPCPAGSLCPRGNENWGTDDPIYLPGLGFEVGDTIRLTAVGSFQTGRDNPFPWIWSGEANKSIISKMIGLFSSDDYVTPCFGFTTSSCSVLDGTPYSTPRVPSAIDAGVDYDTGRMGLSEGASFNTDIAEDFFIPTTSVEIEVPAGAVYLWVAPHDDKKSTGPYGHLYYGNLPVSGFKVQVELVTICGDGIPEGLEACDDGNTADGDCCSSTCSYEGPGSACTDDNVCTNVDTCDGAGTCVAGTPVVCSNGQFCDGVEFCDSGLGCQVGTPPVPDDGVACTIDTCDEVTDSFVFTPDHGACDDQLFCNGAEVCDPVNNCQLGPGLDLDDGVSCTADICNESIDQIVHFPNHAACDDQLFCNGAEVCDLVNDCQLGPGLDLSDGVDCTVDICNESTDQIAHFANDASCDNGLFCDGSETCDLVNDCQPGTAPSADDGVGCTTDGCDEVADAIVNTPDAALCDDANPCTADSCDALAGCGNAWVPGCSLDPRNFEEVPGLAEWGHAALALALLAAGSLFVARRRRAGA